MSDQPHGPGWWQASDGKYYPPETNPGAPPSVPPGFSPDPAGPPDATPPGAFGAPASGPWDQPTYQHGPYAYGSQPPPAGTNGLAVASLVCSILGLCFCGLPAIGGVVLGHVALNQLGRPDNHQQGRGLAIAGLSVGYGLLGLYVVYLIIVLASA